MCSSTDQALSPGHAQLCPRYSNMRSLHAPHWCNYTSMQNPNKHLNGLIKPNVHQAGLQPCL